MFSRIKKHFSPPEPKAIVLMYHRVCDLKTDPWNLAVSPVNFESQIRMLTEKFKVFSVGDLEKQLAARKVIGNSIYITFDDAYVDNYLYAKPILEKYGCPATFFIPTHFIGMQQQFWWDELEAILLHSEELPVRLSIKIDEETLNYHLEAEQLTEDVKKQQGSWKWPEPVPTRRCGLYLKIWEQLKPLSYEKISAIITEIRIWANYQAEDCVQSMAMSAQQLKVLSANKLFSLGLHTKTHPALATHPKDIQSKEIIGCRSFLEKFHYSSINAVAYPYGNYNADTLSVIKENEIALGFTTKAEVIKNDSPAHLLGRYQVLDYSGKELEENLNDWLGK